MGLTIETKRGPDELTLINVGTYTSAKIIETCEYTTSNMNVFKIYRSVNKTELKKIYNKSDARILLNLKLFP